MNTADEFIEFMKTYGTSSERCHMQVLRQRKRIQSEIDSIIERISILLESTEIDVSELQHEYRLLYEANKSMRDFEYEKEMYDWIDYARMADEGYNGIYYSKKLMADRKKLCRPGDGELRSYLEWLGSDTLAVWNWCF